MNEFQSTVGVRLKLCLVRVNVMFDLDLRRWSIGMDSHRCNCGCGLTSAALVVGPIGFSIGWIK